jgi:replicative DNA helicase
MNKGPLHICPRPDITIGQLRAETRRFVSKRDVKLVIADYIQLEGVEAGGEPQVLTRSGRSVAG